MTTDFPTIPRCPIHDVIIDEVDGCDICASEVSVCPACGNEGVIVTSDHPWGRPCDLCGGGR